MFQRLHFPLRFASVLASAARPALLLLVLCSCQTTSTADIAGADITGALSENADAKHPSDSRRDVESYGDRYRANPDDVDAALRYGKALRDAGQRAQAVAVLEKATLAHPANRALKAGYGRALADNGDFEQAFDVLSHAHTPEDPDWRILSAQGAVLDQLGRYDDAQRYYESALKIAPDEPSVLSNLGLSYLLAKDLPKAEETLRRAYGRAGSDLRIRANLALVVGLQGRVAEAETIVKAGLPPEQAAASVAYLRQILSRKGTQRADAGK